MQVIITGASGFVGRNLQHYLESKKLTVLSYSLRDSDWKENFPKEGDAIIHLAGKAHDTANTSDPQIYYKVNRDLTIELFDRFLNSEIQDFFYFSSTKAVIDNYNSNVGLNEDFDARPTTPYGKSKREAEQYLLNVELPKNKRLFIIRPCMIHGPGNKGNLNLLYLVVKKGLPWPLAGFHNKRSFLSIENLGFLVNEMLANDSLSSGIYNFADDKPLSTNSLIKLIGTSIGKPTYLWSIPPVILRCLAKIGDVLPLPLNSERLSKLTESFVVSNEKIKFALKVDKLPISVHAGLSRTIRSFENKSENSDNPMRTHQIK